MLTDFTTDFKLYYSLYVNIVYICIIIVFSLGNDLSIKYFLSFKSMEPNSNSYLFQFLSVHYSLTNFFLFNLLRQSKISCCFYASSK